MKEKSRLQSRNDPRRYLLRGAKRQICPVLQVPLVAKTRYAPSIDKKEPSEGYVKGNIWVISKLANQMKSDATLEEQRKFAEWVKTL